MGLCNLAECIEYLVKVYKNLAFGDLCDIVHALARVVSDTGILIGEASKNRGNNLL